MSLAFQNADTIKQALFDELQNLLSSDVEVLKSAEKRMEQLEYTEGYGVYLAEWIMNQSFELPLRQIACITLTRYVEKHWSGVDDEGQINDCIASEQAKRTIRNILPNGLYDPNSKIRSSVANTITTIAATDWPIVWNELFDTIIKCLGGNENSIHGAMQVLKDFSYDEKQINELGPVVITEVYRIFESEQNYSVKTRTSAIKILKPLFNSILLNIPGKQEKNNMINNILKNFMDKLLHYLSMNCGNSSSFLLRTEIIKLFTFLVSEMPRHIHPHMERILPVIWQLMTQVADIYVRVTVNQTESNPFPRSDNEENDELTNFSTMLVQIFEFIQSIIDNKKFTKIIKSVLTDLIYITIVYIQVPVELMEDWSEDPEKFVEDEDEIGVELTIRLSGQDVLSNIKDEFEDKALPSLQEALRRHMNVAEAEKNSGNPNFWKIQEACMVAVHSFREQILDFEDKFDLMNYLTLVREWVNYQDCHYLVGRALWTLSTYSSSNLYNSQMLEDVLNMTLQNLSSDKSILLKICAVRAIQGFVQAHETTEGEKRSLIQAKLPGFLDGMVGLIPGCKSSVLGLVLQCMATVINFDPGFAATGQNKIIPLTIAVFLKFPSDPYILDIVQDIIKALSKNPSCLLATQEKFVPTIISILALQNSKTKQTEQDIALDILTSLIKYSKAPLPNVLMEHAFPAVVDCVLRTDDHTVMVAGGECLRAFISISPEQVYNYKNGEGMNCVMQVITMLLNPMQNEMTAGQVGRLLITVINKMGNVLGENVDLLLKAVISKLQLVDCLKATMNLVVVFAHLFLTQMDAVLNFLSTVPGPSGEPAMEFVLYNWLSKQSLFFGNYERKVTTMALCKMFEYGLATQDSRLTSVTFKETVVVEDGSPDHVRTRSQSRKVNETIVEIPALVKIFKLLIFELNHYREGGLEFEGDSENDDERASDHDGGDGTGSRFLSDLNFIDDDDEEADDDQLLNEIGQDSIFQINMEENLTKFIQNFSTNEVFGMFIPHLTKTEKNMLSNINVKVN